MVRLLLVYFWVAELQQRGFNPTMVRLLPSPSATSHEHQQKFQSHNGAIAATGPELLTYNDYYVSIPQWCDCCPAP